MQLAVALMFFMLEQLLKVKNNTVDTQTTFYMYLPDDPYKC